MEAEKKQPDSNNHRIFWLSHLTVRVFQLGTVAVLATAPWFKEVDWHFQWYLYVLLAFGLSSEMYYLTYRGTVRRWVELDKVILGARTGLVEVPRRELSPNIPFRQGSAVHSRAIAGVTATLASIAVEPGVVVSLNHPFPEQCTRADLVTAIVFSCGVSRRAAERIFDDLASSLKKLLAEAQGGSSAAVEVFPLGLYESVTCDGARFSSQPFVLQRGYPELGRALQEFECERADS